MGGKFMDIKNGICIVVGLVGGVISSALGGWDSAIVTLLVFMGADFILGLLNALAFHRSKKSKNGALSSSVCWQGIVKKFGTLLIVVCANYADSLLNCGYLRDAVVIAFCASELISICETAGLMGILPEGVQKILTKVIDMLKNSGGDNVENK
nr:MAG TPA: holin [Caudoviricetes sp.]